MSDWHRYPLVIQVETWWHRRCEKIVVELPYLLQRCIRYPGSTPGGVNESWQDCWQWKSLPLSLSLPCRCHLWGAAGHPGQQVSVAGLLQPDGAHPRLVLPELPSSWVPVRSGEDPSPTDEEGLLHREVGPLTVCCHSSTQATLDVSTSPGLCRLTGRHLVP